MTVLITVVHVEATMISKIPLRTEKPVLKPLPCSLLKLRGRRLPSVAIMITIVVVIVTWRSLRWTILRPRCRTSNC
jgi:hypothetical protein